MTTSLLVLIFLAALLLPCFAQSSCGPAASHPEPREALADLPADQRRVLADARREHQRVQAAQRGRQRADLANDAIHEKFDRLRRQR